MRTAHLHLANHWPAHKPNGPVQLTNPNYWDCAIHCVDTMDHGIMYLVTLFPDWLQHQEETHQNVPPPKKRQKVLKLRPVCRAFHGATKGRDLLMDPTRWHFPHEVVLRGSTLKSSQTDSSCVSWESAIFTITGFICRILVQLSLETPPLEAPWLFYRSVSIYQHLSSQPLQESVRAVWLQTPGHTLNGSLGRQTSIGTDTKGHFRVANEPKQHVCFWRRRRKLKHQENMHTVHRRGPRPQGRSGDLITVRLVMVIRW